MPFFSIIIPTYNRADLIEKTINSVLQQDFEDFEIIVVDDGSTDDTKSRVSAITDSRLRYIYQENGERGKARNTGTKAATGKYVFFLDSDDELYPQHLLTAFNALTNLNQPEFFHVRYEEIFETGKKQVPSLNERTILAQIQKQNVFACQIFLKRSIANDFPFSENRALKIGEDWEVILKIAARFPLHFTNEVHAAIHQHEARTMQMASKEVILTSRDLLVENLRADKFIEAKTVKNVWCELTTLTSLSAALSNEKKIAWHYWWKGVKKCPNHIFKRRTLAIFKKIILNGAA